MIAVTTETPISLTQGFRRSAGERVALAPSEASPDTAWYDVYLYHVPLGFGQETGFYVGVPAKIGTKLLSDSKGVDSLHGGKAGFSEIVFVKKERLQEKWFRFARKMSKLFFRTVLTFSKKDACVFDFGSFEKVPGHKETKTYLIFPTFDASPAAFCLLSHLQDMHTKYTQAKAGIPQPLATTQATPAVLPFLCRTCKVGGLVTRSRTFLVFPRKISLEKTTLKDYFIFLATLVFREDGALDRPLDEFQKWLQFGNGMEVRKCLNKTLMDLLSDNEFEYFDAKISPYLSPIRRLLKQGTTHQEVEVAFACPLPKIAEIPDLNCGSVPAPRALSRFQVYERAVSGRLAATEVRLVAWSTLHMTPFNSSDAQSYLAVPSLLVSLEKATRFHECQTYFGLQTMPLPNLYCALQAATINPALNYENFETMGDSVLKFIVSLYLFSSTSDSEEAMSVKKDQIVGNDNLRKRCVDSGLIFFAQTNPIRAKNFVPPGFILNPRETSNPFEDPTPEIYFGTQTFGQKRAADFVEGMIGAAFWDRFDLKESMRVMGKLGLLSGFDFSKFRSAFEDRVALDPERLKRLMSEEQNIKMDDSNHKLFHYFQKKPRSTNPFDDPEDDQPTPTDPFWETLNALDPSHNLLSDALDRQSPSFQRLEFFGDSVLELYTICNTYIVMELLGRPVTPQILHHAKLALITTFQFSRFAVHLGLHKHLKGLSPEKAQEVAQFAACYTPHAPFDQVLSTSDDSEGYIYSSAELEDAFEALVGAIFLAGGWVAVHTFLDDFMAAYLLYFAKFHDTLTLDPKSAIYRHFGRRKIRCITEKAYEGGKHVVSMKIFPGGEAMVIGKGVAGDEATASKIAQMQALTAVFGHK